MIESLIEQLQEGINDSRARRELYDSMLGSQIGASMAGMPAGGGRNGRSGGGGSVRGLGGPGGNGPGGGGQPSNRLEAFLKSMATQESGGRYNVRGIQTSSGQALGKYQILDTNIVGPGGWDMETIGRNVSERAFMRHPKMQERIARGKLRQYVKRYGFKGAAKAWYAGEGNARTNSDAPQYGGPSINDYANSVVRRMRRYLR